MALVSVKLASCPDNIFNSASARLHWLEPCNHNLSQRQTLHHSIIMLFLLPLLPPVLILCQSKPVVVIGDINVCPKEIDIHNPKTNLRSAGFTQVGRV
jgi:hypothetical protein